MSIPARVSKVSSERQWMTRLLHRLADTGTIAAFSLCPLHSWSTKIVSANNKSLKIEQWTALGSGGFVWGGARRLAMYLGKHGAGSGDSARPSWKGLNVIELGAGTGALGLAIAALGANVTLTDQAAFVYPGSREALRSKSLLDLLRINVAHNRHHFQTPASTASGIQEDVQVREMLWGNHTAMLAALPHSTYDVIVASDILLFDRAHRDLLRTLTHLSAAKTVIFIEHTDRSSLHAETYPEDMMKFLALLEEDSDVQWRADIVQDHGRHITLRIHRDGN